jgi:hypothetical protein
MANAPPWGGTAVDIELICDFRKTEYFYKQDWTGQISLIRLKKFVFRRNRHGLTPRLRERGG